MVYFLVIRVFGFRDFIYENYNEFLFYSVKEILFTSSLPLPIDFNWCVVIVHLVEEDDPKP